MDSRSQGPATATASQQPGAASQTASVAAAGKQMPARRGARVLWLGVCCGLAILALALSWAAGLLRPPAVPDLDTVVADVWQSAGVGGQPRQGKILYERNCALCHGRQGNRIPAAPLDSRQFVEGLGEGLTRAIVVGKGAMPAWGQQRGGPLDQQQVQAVAEYLRSGDGTAAQNPVAGKELYSKHCASCHGERGNRLTAVPLDSKEYLGSLGYSGLFAVIAEGKDTMLAFGREKGGPLKAAEVQGIVQYLASAAASTTPLATPAVPAVAAPDGRALFARHCVNCHGPQGGTQRKVRLHSRDYLDARDDVALFRAIAEGRAGMPAFGDVKVGSLSPVEIKAVVAYLRAQAVE